jgi:hypothetical protein
LDAGPEDDEGLRRKLWLHIAREVVQGGSAQGAAAEARGQQGEGKAGGDGEQQLHIKQAVELLKEAGGRAVHGDRPSLAAAAPPGAGSAAGCGGAHPAGGGASPAPDQA